MNTVKKLFGLTAAVAVMGLMLAVLSLTSCGGNGDPSTPAHVHNYGSWTVTKEANCTETGLRYRVCADDETHKETETIAIIPDAHDYRYDPNGGGTAPTCTVAGNGNEVCSYNPNHKRDGVTIPALGHNFIFEEEIKQATCSETGKELWKCTRDDTTEERTVPIDPSAHDWETLAGTAPTCLLPGNGTIKCRLCDEEENGEIEALGHDNGSWHIHTEATCEDDGKEERRCNRDNFVLETKTIGKLGHEWGDWVQTTDPTCTVEGEDTATCERDPEHTKTQPVAALGHNYVWTTTPAACEIAGEEKQICSRDSEHIGETNPIPALDHQYGDWTLVNPTITSLTEAFAVKRTCGLCDKEDTDNITLEQYLASFPENTEDEPIPLILDYDLGNMAISNANGYYSLRVIIARVGRFVSLDLKACTLDNNVFNTGDIATGKNKITAIALPTATTQINRFWGGFSVLKSVTVPNGVTTINDYAFYNIPNLTGNIADYIPNSVTSIGQQAFDGCSGLTGSLTIPNGVQSIDYGAFFNCSGLTGLTIPNSVESIGDRAFWTCSGLTGSLTIPNGANIGDNAFLDCTGLTSVTISAGVTTTGIGMFQNCTGLTSVIISTGVTTIGIRMFRNCTGLTSVTIPNSVESIGQGAFDGCSRLASVTFQRADTTFFGFPDSDSFPGAINTNGSLYNVYNGIGTYTRNNPTGGTIWDGVPWVKQQ